MLRNGLEETNSLNLKPQDISDTQRRRGWCFKAQR